MFLISIIAHLLIFLIAPSQNVLVTNMVVTNAGVSALSEVDMPRLITQTMLKTFPISIFCCATISALFSCFFSRGITTPILSLSKSANQMSKLEPGAKAAVLSTDEIGALATDINNLYQSLLLTIRNLELEKEKVSLAEKEKIDFLRTASHELKTPVTELNATLENMILGIGEYRDYETYLPKCKEITEQLGDMIRDILNASRMQTQGNNEPCSNFSLRALLTELCEPYRLIAEAKERTWKHGRNQNLFYPETMGGTCLYGISDRGHVQRDLHHRPAAPYSSFEENIKGTITDFASAPKARTPSRDHIQTKRGTILQKNCASFRFLIRLPRSRSAAQRFSKKRPSSQPRQPLLYSSIDAGNASLRRMPHILSI